MDDSEFSHSDTEDSKPYNIDDFLSEHLDNILDIYYDIQERFPYFLDKVTSTAFVDFIIDNAFYMYDTKHVETYFKKNTKSYTKFIQEYSKEITTTYILIDNFLQKQNMNAIDTILFNKFCFMNSFLQ